MTPSTRDDHELDQHLRRTLLAVAATVQDDPGDAPVPSSLPSRPRSRRRRFLVGAGTAVVALPLAAAAIVGIGPEYVDRLPPADPIVSGSVDGERYWIVDGRDMAGCEGHPSGVEVIIEENNVLGREWNTFGAAFGEPTSDGCASTEPGDAVDLTYFADGGGTIGDGMLWVGALHPDVDQVRVALGGGEPFDVETFEHEGGSYYALEVPPGTGTFRVEYLVDGEVVPPPAGEDVVKAVPHG